MIIGIDDTDSKKGMCTTYLGALIIEGLSKYGKVYENPLLIRLNPMIPHKTRGNASIGIRIDTNSPEKVIDFVISKIKEFAEMEDKKTNPGVVFIFEKNISKEHTLKLVKFFNDAVKTVLSIQDTKNIIEELGLKSKGFKNGRGLIGALAACGAMLDNTWDYTYEYIAYRKLKSCGTKRIVDKDSIYKADHATYPKTWDTVDIENNIIVCVPRSPDPVLYGIRGESPEIVQYAASIIQSEPFERFCVYKTNQGTDMHLIFVNNISEIENMHSYSIEGVVSSIPTIIQGGHTIFKILDDAGEEIYCAAYEPTKNFRKIIRKLSIGDRIVVMGSVNKDTLNIEKIEIKSLVNCFELSNPICPICNKRMKSKGMKQGYKCKKCKTHSNSVIKTELKRELLIGLYEVPPSARRHIAKPLIRC